MNSPALLTPREAAAFLQMSEQTLEKWRSKGTGPKFRRLGHRTVRYLQDDLLNWPGMTQEEQHQDTTSKGEATTDNPVIIYTDGACKGNPGPGGWGVVISRNGRTKELHGGTHRTTNNQMELTAVIKGLEALKKPLPVRLYSDSKYIVEGMTMHMENWKAKGWRKSDGKPATSPRN